MITIPGMLMVGARSKADGKTTFACTLIERFSPQVDVVGIKISAIDSVNESYHPNITGPGKNKLPAYPYCITEERGSSGHTDTARMLRAGAKKVLWLEAANAHLEEGIDALVSHVDKNAVSVCESNRARREIEPGVFALIRSSQEATWKTSAKEVVEYVDRIIVSQGNEFDIDPNDIQLIGGRWTIKTPATAVILAGGNSTRMGRDKAMLPIRRRPMIEHIYRQLSPWFSQMIISANDKNRYSFLDVPVIQDRILGTGPLMGIASALRASTSEVNFVTASDIPEIDIDLVRAMLWQADGYDAVVPRIGSGKYEPVFAVYKKSALEIIEQALKLGINRISEVLNRCKVKYIELPGRQFKNINTIGEYQRFIEENVNVVT
ncbi:MAG: NTP transferase domain-containing protein [Phycisphaerales bacterium]|nr:MAG: NTP transferase domain-containing protein [Phycisphaerales bacterium]